MLETPTLDSDTLSGSFGTGLEGNVGGAEGFGGAAADLKEVAIFNIAFLVLSPSCKSEGRLSGEDCRMEMMSLTALTKVICNGDSWDGYIMWNKSDYVSDLFTK